jgi:toxin YoeB
MGKFTVNISDRAKREILEIRKSGDKASTKKIEAIILDLYEHPETGVGKPERLKFELSGYWSRQINKKDRLIYNIEDTLITVTIISALGHYGDR